MATIHSSHGDFKIAMGMHGDFKIAMRSNGNFKNAMRSHGDLKITEFGVSCGDFVEAHFVDDVFDVGGGFGEERDAPFVFVEAGGAGDQLEDASGVGAADAGVAGHEVATGFVIERIPVIVSAPAFGHGIEANNWPIGKLRIDAVGAVVSHPLVEFFKCGGVFFAIGAEVLFGDQSFGDILLAGGGVFGRLGDREIGIRGC